MLHHEPEHAEADAPEHSLIDADNVIETRREVASLEIDGETVVFDQEDGSTHVLNATAGLLWRLLDGERRLGEIADELAELFHEDAALVNQAVLTTAQQFAELGLLRGQRPANPGPESTPTGAGSRKSEQLDFLVDPPST